MNHSLQSALFALGNDALTETSVRQQLFPLFSKVLARPIAEIYLANHSLGRPLDATAIDLVEGTTAWFEALDAAWMPWWSEMQAWRANTARLVNAARADCIVPKTSAGQGLRAVLNSFSEVITVLTTEGEFDSIDHILKQYEAKGRIRLISVAAGESGQFCVDDLMARLDGVQLVVVSQVFFATGQLLGDLDRLVTACHDAGAQILLDTYHGVGVVPTDLAALAVDYAVGGSYKYLRGGPGVCWLYLSPTVLAAHPTTLDTGWFAKRDPFSYQRPVPPAFADGGDAWLESTFNPLGFYQARAGLALVNGLGVARLRDYSLGQKHYLSAALDSYGIAHFGAGDDFGAFLTIPHPAPMALCEQLKAVGVNGDARAAGLRLCPDLLTTHEEMDTAARQLAGLLSH